MVEHDHLNLLLGDATFGGSEASPPVLDANEEAPRRSAPPENQLLEHLASAIGCDAVLQDLSQMIRILSSSKTRAKSRVGAIMLMFDLGESNVWLGTLQKDLSGLFIARRYKKLLVYYRYLISENQEEKRKGRHAKKSGASWPMGHAVDLVS